VQNNETVQLLGMRGQHLPLQLSVGQSLQGLWASPDGLHLVLDGTNLSTVVVPPKEPTWKSETFENCGGCNDVVASSMLISGLLTIPPFLRAETIKGKLTGTILYPVDADQGFANTSISITIALHITLISAERYTQLVNGEDQASGFLTLINFVCVLPLLVATIIFTFQCRRQQR
jgi:hypothetical protein